MGTKKSNKLYAAAAALAVTASAVAPGLTADAASKVTVKSVTNPASISHYGGYTFAVKKLSLPKTVKVLLSNKKYENRSVKWGKVSYDKKYIGKYQTISGTVSGTTKKASIKVKLNNYPVDVVEPKLAPVAVGEKLNLPSTIDVKYKDGKVIARSAKSFNLTAEKTDKAGMMKLSYNYMGKNSSIKGSIAYEVKAAEITNVMDEVKDDMLSVSADVKYAAKDAKVEVLVYPGKDASKALPFAAELKDGKLTAKTTALPAGSHSYVVKVGDVLSTPKDFSVEELKATVKAASSKTLEVSFNKVIDSTKAVVELKKDGFKVNAAKITPSADKKSLIVELTSKITKGEYALNVSGLSDKALEASVKTEDEKVAGIELLSDIAPITGEKVAVGYKVVNQYGEEVTKIESVEVSVAGATGAEASAGQVTFDQGALKAGDKVVVTLIHKATATSTTKTVTVSNAAKASEVSFGTLYNKDGKTLNEDTNLSVDKFYLPLEVKDQYGNKITDASKLVKDELFLTNTNPLAVDFNKTTPLKTIKINDVDTLVLELTAPDKMTYAGAGETTFTAIAAASGKNSQAKVVVAEATRSDVVKLGATQVFAKDTAYVPVTVLDKSGNEIKDVKVLKDAVKGIKVTSSVGVTADKLVEKDGAFFIEVAGLTNTNDVHTVVVQSSTNKVATLTLTAKEAIAPKVITGLTSATSTSIREQAKSTTSISAKNLVVEDQYGQVIAADKLLSRLGADYTIVAETSVDAPFTAEGTITKDGGSIAVTYVKPKADKSSGQVIFKLAKKGEAIEASAFSKEFSVVKDSAFTSYKASDIAPIFVQKASYTVQEDGKDVTKEGYQIPANYEQAIVVKAVTNAGGLVELTAGEDYTVKSSVVEDSKDAVIDGLDAAGIKFAEGATTTTAKVTITINATGEEIVKEVTFSNVAPKISTVELVKEGSIKDGVIDDAGVAALQSATLEAAPATQAEASFNLSSLEDVADIVVTDQYGVRAAYNETTDSVKLGYKEATPIAPTLTFTKVSGEVTFEENGTKAAAAKSFTANSVFNVKFNVGSASATPLKVTASNSVTPQ